MMSRLGVSHLVGKNLNEQSRTIEIHRKLEAQIKPGAAGTSSSWVLSMARSYRRLSKERRPNGALGHPGAWMGLADWALQRPNVGITGIHQLHPTSNSNISSNSSNPITYITYIT